jgi:hypothetical protein
MARTIGITRRARGLWGEMPTSAIGQRRCCDVKLPAGHRIIVAKRTRRFMPSTPSQLDALAASRLWRYRASTKSAAEPAAWTALALAAHGRFDEARRPAAWLASLQQPDGSVGVSEAESTPCWPTSLAMWAWIIVGRRRESDQFDAHINAAIEWAIANRGKSAARSSHIGHDTELSGWSWAADTHSWLEPTCMFVLALRAAGYGDHARVREGVRLIIDRLLPDGGANYGNTIVLGQPLVPHVQPTGLALIALAGEDEKKLKDPRVGMSLDYLASAIDEHTSATSLAFACWALRAHGRDSSHIDACIASSLERADKSRLAEHELALLLLAEAAATSHALLTAAPQEAL